VPGMTLTARARALENAGADEIARFVNLQSNRTVEAMVEGPGRARVVSGGTAS
jgi:flagella basal body P-ring formation protein FlgA